jgi:hypothetical protein
MATKTALLKRLEAIEKAISIRRRKLFVLNVPVDDGGLVTAEAARVISDLLTENGRGPDDMVIQLLLGNEPEPPQLLSITYI